MIVVENAVIDIAEVFLFFLDHRIIGLMVVTCMFYKCSILC